MKKIEPIIGQKLKLLIENSESLINNAKETYALHGHKVKRKITLQKQNNSYVTTGKYGNDKRNIQLVFLLSFENDLTTSPKTVTDTKTDPKSDEQQQSHNENQ